MTKLELRAAYANAKKVYYAAGERARGKPPGSQEQKDYATAREAYHAAGVALANTKQQAL